VSGALGVDPDVLMPKPGRKRRLGLRTQLRSGRLDSRLASGTAPESSDLLFTHARRIVRPRSCAALASGLRNVAVAAQRPARMSKRVPVARPGIDAARGELFALAERLERPGPIQARGVAHVRLLLGSGSSPLYRGQSDGRLLAELRAASAQL
jgi:hypothetical protein